MSAVVTCEEIHVYTTTVVISTRSLLGAAAVACTLFASSVAAKDHNVTITLHVSAQGLDLSQPADAQTFYYRLEHAARVVCTHGNRVGLEPPDDPKACYEKALGGAIRSAKVARLTQIYLANHALREAAMYGIDALAAIAAK